MAKKKHGGPARAASKPSTAAPEAPNMFETIWSRRKFNVLGKKQKGEGKRLGQLRSRAIDKRKKTLLQEFKQRHKNNAFFDNRFGEHDENLTADQKAIMRFTRERQHQIKRESKFALPDDDEGTFLTHKGAALSTLDDFQDDVPGEDDEEPLEFDEETIRQMNFGGGETGDHPKEKKSKKEVMEELIAKSKHYKALKAKEKEEDHRLREKLDEDFEMLSQDRALLSLVKPKKRDALLGKQGGSKDTEKPEAAAADTEKEGPDDYDKLIKQMTFELRAQASERLKTAEEIAQEEKERLEELERKRKKRMLGLDSESEDNESDAENESRQRRKRKRPAEISGDDLGDDFVLEDEEKGWVDEVMARRQKDAGEDEDEEGEDGDEDDDEDHEEEADDEDADEDTVAEDPEADDCLEMEDTDTEGTDAEDIMQDDSSDDDRIRQKRATFLDKSRTQPAEGGADVQSYDGELPYIINAPQSLEEFKRLVGDRSIQELETAIQRINTCNAISLAAENRKKMQIFYNVLLLYFSEVAAARPFATERINTLTKFLITMSSGTPYFAAVCARERLVRMQKQLTEKLRAGGKACPTVRTLCLLRLWSLIFPASDFRHPVITPMMLLMGEYLIRCPITSGRDVAVGSFLCSLTLSVMKHAKRFCPEALSFLLALLSSGLDDASSARKNSSQYLKELILRQPWLRLKDADGSRHLESIEALNFIDVMTTDEGSEIFDSDAFRIGILNGSLETLKGFMAIYDDLVSYPEVFAPFLPVLTELSSKKELPLCLKKSLLYTTSLMKDRIREHERFRQPLRIRHKPATPIKQYNPKFEEEYVKGRNYDIDKERAEKKKLMKQLKREAKGAARELRKDNQFLAREKTMEMAQAREDREEKYRKAMAFLQEQEAAAKSGQLGKKRRKR